MSAELATPKKSFPFLILPTVAWYLTFLVIPLAFIFVFSFTHKGDFGRIEYIFDIANYKRVLEYLYFKMVLRSVGLAVFTTSVCFLISFPVAYAMARAPQNIKTSLLGLIIVPFWTNFVIRVYALKLVIGDSGIINKALLSWGLIESPLPLTNSLTGVGIGMIYNYLPFMVLPLFVTLDKFDFTLLDAAYDLGANRFQTLIRILLPLSTPGIITGCIFVFIPAFGEFVIPDLLGGSQTMYVGNLITEAFLKNHDWPFGSALSSLLVIMSMIAFLFTSSGSVLRGQKSGAH